MENKRNPQQNEDWVEDVSGMPELEIEAESAPTEILLEDIMDEEGNLDLEATLDMTLEEVEALLAQEPVSDETVVFAPVETGEPVSDETVVFAPVETGEPVSDETVVFAPVETGEPVFDETMVLASVETEEPASGETVVFSPVEPEALAQTHMPASVSEVIYSDADVALSDVSDDTDWDMDFAEPDYDEGFRETETDEDFDSKFRNPAQTVIINEPKPREPRKGRPKRKKGYGLFGLPHLAATAVWLLIIVSIGVSLGRMLWLCAADVLAFGRKDKAVTITIGANDTIDDIADNLYKHQLIRYPGLFKLYASLAVDEGEIATGTFTLNTLYDYHAIVNGMSSYSSFREVVEDVLIPEGYNCRQIFELLEEKGVCSVAELEEYAANGEFQDFWFLEDVERGDKYCLEGYLFPDTYDFYAGSTPREAIGKMLLGFNSRIDQEEISDKLNILNNRLSTKMRENGCSETFIIENRIGVRELLIVASLIEEETASTLESKDIASVIYNRLTEDQVYERYLGIDATILYALGYHKDELTQDDLSIDSPYNTRTHAGLVPTPISNPGLNSIEAALDPSDTEYYYYLLNPSTGMHTFSRTAAEHDALKVEYGY